MQGLQITGVIPDSDRILAMRARHSAILAEAILAAEDNAAMLTDSRRDVTELLDNISLEDEEYLLSIH